MQDATPRCCTWDGEARRSRRICWRQLHPPSSVQLDEADVLGVLAEALPAHVQAVLTDEAVAVRAHAARAGALAEFPGVAPVELLMPHAACCVRALHGAAPWRRRWERERAGGSGGAAEGRQPRGGVLRGGGGQRRAPPQPPRPRPFPPSMLPAVAASQRSRWAAAREAGREGESSGPGPAPAGRIEDSHQP